MEEKKKEKDEYKEALDFLDISEDEIKSKSMLTHKKETDLTNKVTAIKDMVLDYQMYLEGKSYDAEKGGYIQTGKALAGREFIKLSAGILNSYANPSNLLTQKDKDTFVIQFKNSHEVVNMSLSMRNRAVPERTQRAILKIFKDTLWNIGEIIIGSSGNMQRIFEKNKEEEIIKKDIGGF